MYAGDDAVTCHQQRVRVIQRAVRQNVTLRTREQLDSPDLRVDPTNIFDVPRQLLGGKAAGHRTALGMVGDRYVLVTPPLGGEGHLFDSVSPVAGNRVHVQIAANVLDRNKLGPIHISPQLVAPFPLFRRNPRQPQLGVDFLLAFARDSSLAVIQAVLAQVKSLANRYLS